MRRILIIDDEDDIREVAALSLESVAGWQISTADCAAEGIKKAIAEKPDAILMDVMMPEMDGYEAASLIRSKAEFAHLPIIAVTAKAMQGDREKSLAAGASDYVTKPVDAATLIDRVRVCLDR